MHLGKVPAYRDIKPKHLPILYISRTSSLLESRGVALSRYWLTTALELRWTWTFLQQLITVSVKVSQHTTSVHAMGTAPIFLSEFTTEFIKVEFDDIRCSISLAMDNSHLHLTTANIDRLLAALTSASSVDASILVDMASGWAQVYSLEVNSHISSLILRKQRMATMLFAHRMWYWIDVYIGKAISNLLDGKSRDDLPWLGCLINKVRDFFEYRMGKLDFLPSVYGIPGLGGVSCTIKWTETWPRLCHTRNHVIASTVTKILQQWFNYPSHPTTRAQAWFVHVIVMQIGFPLLYFDNIWKVYSNVHSRLFLRGSWCLDSFEQVQALCEAVPSHPLFNHGSEEYGMLQELGQLLDAYYSDALPTSTSPLHPLEETQLSTTLQSIASN